MDPVDEKGEVVGNWCCPSWSGKGGELRKMHSLLSGELFIGELHYTRRVGVQTAPGGS